ncbi:MAG: DnaJ C-terminal domain-containing protein, partial [Asticcacaulis sp.]
SEPLPISVAQAISGGPTRVDVPMPLELIHDAGPGRSLMHRKSLRLTLPAGLRDGDRLRLKATRPGGTEHVFRIEIRREEGLYAAGNDLFLTLALDARRLRRGGHLTLPTPHGERDIELAPSPDGAHLKLSGLGLPATAKHPQGDLHLTIEAIVPPSRPASELLAEFHMKWA